MVIEWDDLLAIPWSQMERWEQKRLKAMILRRAAARKHMAIARSEERRIQRELEYRNIILATIS